LQKFVEDKILKSISIKFWLYKVKISLYLLKYNIIQIAPLMMS